jgi:hypothetical protein
MMTAQFFRASTPNLVKHVLMTFDTLVPLTAQFFRNRLSGRV